MFDEERHLGCFAAAVYAFEENKGSTFIGRSVVISGGRVDDHGYTETAEMEGTKVVVACLGGGLVLVCIVLYCKMTPKKMARQN